MSQMVAAQARKPAQNAAATAGGVLQRKCDNCRKKKPLLQRAAAGPSPETVPPIVHQVLRSPGQPLDAVTRAFMEPRFGHDFSRVRVHTDARAAESARAVNALAYTVGKDIVFGKDRYSPGTCPGRRILAHELTHSLQQDSSSSYSSNGNLEVDPSLDAENEASNTAINTMLSSPPSSVTTGFALGLQRVTLSLQRGGEDRCSGSGAKCAIDDECANPDRKNEDREENSRSWTLLVNIDIERSSWEEALRKQEFGHTYVKFVESNGRRYTYGFYPAGTLPNENNRTVPGCVHHPDTTHDTCINDTVMYSLNQNQYNSALAVAQNICRAGHTYGVGYTCTTYAEEIVRAAGQSLPSSRSKPTSIFYQSVPSIDNPNTLYENVQEERRRDPLGRFPYWNNPCLNRCEAQFNNCTRTSRTGGLICISQRASCLAGCGNR
jgi:hypothetical protein